MEVEVAAPPTTTKTKTGFLDLSPELRNKIYHLAFVEENCLFIYETRERGQKWRVEFLETQTQGLPVALLRVCKIVYSEATPVLYGANSFDIGRLRKSEILNTNTFKHVRTLELAGGVSPLRETLVVLRKLALGPGQLQKLRFDKLEVACIGTHGLARKLVPLLRALKKSHGIGNEVVYKLEIMPRVRADYGEAARLRASQIAESDTKNLRGFAKLFLERGEPQYSVEDMSQEFR